MKTKLLILFVLVLITSIFVSLSALGPNGYYFINATIDATEAGNGTAYVPKGMHISTADFFATDATGTDYVYIVPSSYYTLADPAYSTETADAIVRGKPGSTEILPITAVSPPVQGIAKTWRKITPLTATGWAGTSTTVVTFAAEHYFEVGDQVYITGAAGTSASTYNGKAFTLTAVSNADPFTITFADDYLNLSVTGGSFSIEKGIAADSSKMLIVQDGTTRYCPKYPNLHVHNHVAYLLFDETAPPAGNVHTIYPKPISMYTGAKYYNLTLDMDTDDNITLVSSSATWDTLEGFLYFEE